MDLIKRFVLAVPMLISSAHGIASTQSTSAQWQTEFGASGTPALHSSYGSVNLSRNPSGETFLEISHPNSMSNVIRLDASGNSVWAISNYRQDYSDLAPLQDGSVLVIADVLSFYSPTGALLWSAYIPTTYDGILSIVEVDNEIYASAAGTAVPIYKIDRFSGLVIETLQSDALYAYCGSSAMYPVGKNTIYVTSPCGSSVSKILTNPLRIEWSKSPNMSAIAADETGVFVRSRTSTNGSLHAAVQKLATANGEMIWSSDQATLDILDARLDIDGHLLIRRESTIEKVHGATGLHIWQHQAADRITGLDTSPAGVFLSLDSTSSPSISGGKAAGIDRNTGNVLWTAPLPPPASFDKSAARNISVADDRLIVSGTKCNGPQTNLACTLQLWSMSTDGTDLTSPTPTIELTSKGNAVLVTNDITLAAALESGPSGLQITAKKIRNSDGSIIWQSTHPVPLAEFPSNYNESAWIQEAGDGDAVILYSNPPRDFTPNSSGVAILKLNGVSGALRWKRTLLDPGSSYTDIKTYNVTSDNEGNIFASICLLNILERGGNPPPVEDHERYVVKLASATGQQQSRLDFNSSSEGTCWPPDIRSIANDLLLNELPSPSGRYALSRVKGATGQVIWERSGRPPHIRLIDGNMAYATPFYGTNEIMGINLDDGSTRWTTQYSDPRDLYAVLGEVLLDSQGGLLVGARRDAVNNSNHSPNRGMLLRLDKTTGDLLWAHRLEQTPNRSVNLLWPAVEQSGIVYSRQYAKASNENVGYFLLANSLSTGEFLGAQFFNYWIQKQTHLEQDSTLNIVGSASDGGLILAGFHRTPGTPHQFRIAKWSQPSAIAGGALKVELSASASGSQAELHFIFDTINHGTIPAHDVLATLSFPGNAIVGNVECDISGTPCVPQRMQGFIEHKLDLPAGQRLRLSGSLTILDSWQPPTLHANAYGAYGFSEMDLRDNWTSLSVEMPLFSDGFD